MFSARLCLLPLLTISSVAIAANSISRVALDPLGNPIANASFEPSLSRDGKRVLFHSGASNVVPGDTNGQFDIFVRDLVTNQTQIVTTTAAGVQANNASLEGRISADGRFVVFSSFATNLAASDANGGLRDVFVKDLVTGALAHASLSSSGTSGNNSSGDAWVNADGRFVVFQSFASNLVANDTNGKPDVFLRDIATGQLECISVDASGVPTGGMNPSLSGDGRYVAYMSLSGNLGVILRDRQLATSSQVCVDASGMALSGSQPMVSEDGGTIVFSTGWPLVAGDQPTTDDLYFVRLQSGVLTLPKLVTKGNLLFGENLSEATSISSDGRYVTFRSTHRYVADDLNNEDDVYLADLTLNKLMPVSKGPFGFGDSDSYGGSISADGKTCAFYSNASNLVANGAEGTQEAFLADLSGEAKWKIFGAGVSGSAGALELELASDPELGKANALTVSVGNGSIPAFVLTGVIPFTAPTVYGGLLYLVPTATVATTATAAGTVLPFVIRNEPDLAGFTFYAQALGLDAGAPQGVSFSAAIEAVIGN